MLLQKLKQAQDTINEVTDLQAKVDQHQQYKDYYDALKQESLKCSDYIESHNSLVRYYPGEFSRPNVRDFLSKLNDLENTFEKEPKRARIPANFRELDAHSKALEAKWYKFALKESNEALNTLSNVVRITGPNQEIDQIISSLKSLATKWPLKEQNVIYFQKQCQNAKLKLTELKAGDTVQDFLEKVSHKQATIADITPEVIQWLQKNDFEKNLVIRFK